MFISKISNKLASQNYDKSRFEIFLIQIGYLGQKKYWWYNNIDDFDEYWRNSIIFVDLRRHLTTIDVDRWNSSKKIMSDASGWMKLFDVLLRQSTSAFDARRQSNVVDRRQKSTNDVIWRDTTSFSHDVPITILGKFITSFFAGLWLSRSVKCQ